jgi:nucleoside-diphosphate-sugar epimerase
MADAAHTWGCRHFIFSSAPLGPLSEAEAEGTFIGMRLPVEKHIKSLKGMTYTFLRPSQFMENLLPTSPYMFKLTRTILLRYTFYTHPERKHQMISVRDIGRTGALAVTSVGTAKQDKYLNQAVELAGDEYTMQELRDKYRKVMGEEITECWNPLAYGLAKGFPLLRNMSRWWDRYGFCADIKGLREEIPELEDLTMFLERYKAEQGRQ